jgi:hypothetical protein
MCWCKNERGSIFRAARVPPIVGLDAVGYNPVARLVFQTLLMLQYLLGIFDEELFVLRPQWHGAHRQSTAHGSATVAFNHPYF